MRGIRSARKEVAATRAIAQDAETQFREDMKVLRLSKTLRWMATLALISVGGLFWYVSQLY